MDDVFAGSLMSTPVHTVSPDASVQDAAREMLDHGIGSLVVVDEEERLEGVLTATDFVHVSADDAAATATPVEEYMSAPVRTATVTESLTAVADRIIDHGFHHLPVVDDEQAVVGIITTADVTAYVSGIREPSPPASVPGE